MSVEEVVDRNWVTLLCLVGAVLEHLLGVSLRADSHVLLAEATNMLSDVGALLDDVSVEEYAAAGP